MTLLLQRLECTLDRLQRQRKTMTYLQCADAIDVQPPYRIHQVAELLESLIERDVRQGRPIRAALVVSRARAGRPAEGFYLKAKTVAVFDGTQPDQFHEQCLQDLFDHSF
ncbi:MAG: hypothetical protein AAF446_09120 [Pseudomonadota bacterium]